MSDGKEDGLCTETQEALEMLLDDSTQEQHEDYVAVCAAFDMAVLRGEITASQLVRVTQALELARRGELGSVVAEPVLEPEADTSSPAVTEAMKANVRMMLSKLDRGLFQQVLQLPIMNALCTPISTMSSTMGVRAERILTQNWRMYYVFQLVQKTRAELLRLPGLGETRLGKIERSLSRWVALGCLELTDHQALLLKQMADLKACDEDYTNRQIAAIMHQYHPQV
jgi:hypothetical protein